MLSICQSFDSQPADVTSMLEILKLIVNRYTLEDLSKRLLVEVFLQMEEMYFLNVDLNILLMKNSIIPIQEWDK